MSIKLQAWTFFRENSASWKSTYSIFNHQSAEYWRNQQHSNKFPSFFYPLKKSTLFYNRATQLIRFIYFQPFPTLLYFLPIVIKWQFMREINYLFFLIWLVFLWNEVNFVPFNFPSVYVNSPMPLIFIYLLLNCLDKKPLSDV